MINVNKVIIQGRLGRDPQVREGDPMIANLAVATSRYYKDRDGNRKEETEWHSVTLFGKQAEIASQWLRKGSGVYVEGRLHTRSYEKDGQKRYVTEIIGENMQLGDRPQDEQQQSPQQSTPQQQPRYSQDYRERPSRAQSPAASRDHGQSMDVDEDIPF